MERAAGTQPAAAYASRSIKAAAHKKTESAKSALFFCPLRAYFVAGCVIIPAADEKRAESQKTAFARVCALQPSYRVWPNRARIIRGRAFDPRLWVRPIACAFVGRVCGRAKAAAEKAVLRACAGLAARQNGRGSPSIRSREKTTGKTARPGDGS